MRPAASNCRGRRQVLLGAAGMLLSGCALLSQPKPPQLYVLRPRIAPPMGGPVNWRLAVAAPGAPASLDTERIALTRSATTMDYFANAAWTDRLPLIVQRILIQAFEETGRIASVDRDTLGLSNDLILETEIRDFQARYDTPNGPPEVDIGIQVKLERMPDHDIIGSVYVTQQAMAAGNTIDNIVVAFNQATGAALSQVVAWTLNRPPPQAA